MADYDSFSYEINSRLPEWWKNDALAFPINEYTHQLIAEILEGFLSNFGVVQPLNVWKSIPEEYDYYHHYTELDEKLLSERNDGTLEETPVCTFFAKNKMHAFLPNTKRNCHANIKIRLTGGEITDDKQTIDEFIITNGVQQIVLHDISKVSTIDILTDSQQILIDGEAKTNLIEGSFEKIYSTIKYPDYQVPYIDSEGNISYSDINLEDENKETKITFETTDTVDFKLEIYLLDPTYTVEQNIRIATVSAFPIEWVRLYGYFCHPFNNKEGYKFLWEKKYDERSRTVYDRITKQFDCERFYIQVKFYGIGTPLMKGFPQEEFASNPIFQINPNLDKWGKIYGIPRRVYRDDITEDEEKYTFPRYYNYPIEQDYWYEERIVNEYRFDDEAINSAFVKDDELNNIARLVCIYPFMNDIWVYTETINPDSDITHEFKDASKCDIKEVEGDVGKSINQLKLLEHGQISEETILEPYNNEIIKRNDFSYQTKRFEISFCLAREEAKIPKDIKITGIELKFKAATNLHSNSLRISDDSVMVLPFFSTVGEGGEISEEINISGEQKYWLREKSTYTIGGENYLFGQEQITREQLFNNKKGKLTFKIGFINESDFLQAKLLLEDINLILYYETITDDYSMETELTRKTIGLDSNNLITELKINLTKDVNKKIEAKNLFIILPPELEFETGYYNHYKFSFDKTEDKIDILSLIKPKKDSSGNYRTGRYDILIFTDEYEFKEELVVRSKE